MEEDKMLPKEYYSQLGKKQKHRVVADYIASMSDRHAIHSYKEMYGKMYLSLFKRINDYWLVE